MQTRSKLVTYKEVETRIDILLTLYPRPNSKNTRSLIKVLAVRPQGILSYQSLRHGHKGFVTPAKEYALTGEALWVDYQDPGLHWSLGGNAAQQRDTDVRFTVASNTCNNQENATCHEQSLNSRGAGDVPQGTGRHGPCHLHSHRRPKSYFVGIATPIREENAHREGGGNTAVGPAVESQRTN